MKITVYSKNSCMQCMMVKRFLKENGLAYHEINIDKLDYTTHQETLNYIKDGLGYSALPVIVLDSGESFYGFNIDKLRALT